MSLLLRLLARLGLIIVGIIGIALFTMGVLYIRYKQWERSESKFLNDVINQEYSDAQEKNVDLLLEKFQSSVVEKESLRFSRDDFEILITNGIKENSPDVEIEGVELITLNRSFDFYYKQVGYPWIIVRIWQRQEGSTDFVVYDIKLGPISLSSLSWGWINSQFSQGIRDSMDLIFSDNFSARKINNIYIFENGLRFVGVIEKEDVDSE